VKDVNTDFPKVSILKPYENQIFQVGDTISIEADVTYSSKIEGVSVTLCNENYIHVMRSYNVYLKINTSQKIVFVYPLDDNFLPSGDYYLEITVIGENNSKNKYVKLRIAGFPKENKGLGIVVKKGSNSELIYLDSVWQPHYQKIFFGNHVASSYLPFHNIFTEITDGSSETSAINFFSGKQEWKVTKAVVPVGPYFSGTFVSDKKIDILLYDYRVETYSYDGKKRGGFLLNSDYFPVLSLHLNDLWIIYQKKKSNHEIGILSVYYGATGALIQSYSIDFQIIKYFIKNDNELVVFGNKKGNALVKVYYIDNNVFWEPRALGASLLSDAVQINDDIYLYLQNAHLMKFDLVHAWVFDLGLIGGNQRFSKLKYDEIDAMLYLSDNLQIKAVSFPDLTPVNTYLSNDSIRDFHIIYNN